jgi:hypothetical protein
MEDDGGDNNNDNDDIGLMNCTTSKGFTIDMTCCIKMLEKDEDGGNGDSTARLLLLKKKGDGSNTVGSVQLLAVDDGRAEDSYHDNVEGAPVDSKHRRPDAA